MLNTELNKFANKIDVYLKKDIEHFSNKVIDELSSENYFLILSRFNVSSPVYLSENALELIGSKSKEEFKNNWFFIENVIDTDSSNIIIKALKHFFKKPHEDFDMCYQIKTLKGQKKWVYAVSRVITFTNENKPDFILTIGVEIEKMLQNQLNERLGLEASDLLKSNINIKLKSYLTEREQEVLNLVALGLESNEIAEKLYISVHTVKTHRKNLMRKLKVNNGSELMRFAILSQLFEK